jgi:hypothetical protein
MYGEHSGSEQHKLADSDFQIIPDVFSKVHPPSRLNVSDCHPAELNSSAFRLSVKHKTR